jgi:hypothetical protein
VGRVCGLKERGVIMFVVILDMMPRRREGYIIFLKRCGLF